MAAAFISCLLVVSCITVGGCEVGGKVKGAGKVGIGFNTVTKLFIFQTVDGDKKDNEMSLHAEAKGLKDDAGD